MKKTLFLAAALSYVAIAAAQTTGGRLPQPQIQQQAPQQQTGQQQMPRQQQQQQGEVPMGDSLDDVSPPIPITRQVIGRIVKDRVARVLSTDEIEDVKTATSNARLANVSPYPKNKMPVAVHRTITFVPDTNKPPEKVRLWLGAVSAVVFTDMAGNAWNIESVSLNCNQFDDGRSCGNAQGASSQSGNSNGSAPTGPAAPTNMLTLQPLTQYAYGNAVIRLQGMASPVVIVLETGLAKNAETDMQLDVRVQGRNPGARPQMMMLQTLPGFDARMGDFLDGVPPTGAKQMKVSGGVAEAWLYNDQLYVRTRVSVLSPAFTDHVGSAEGVQVYKYGYAVPNLLASINGAPTTLIVTGN